MASLSMNTMESDAEERLETESLRTRILKIVKSSKNHTIRPAKLSSELGISMDDANAELCGLLKAVGIGSTFHFEDVNGVNAMVFTFPPNFENKAAQSERKEDFSSLVQDTLAIVVKVAKIVTAFGLILSTIIVSIAGMVAMVAALVALSRGGGDSRHARNTLSRQLRSLFEVLRQLMWCYSMMGPTGDDDQDPFFREAAYDTSLVMSLCCGNPANMWFWMRARNLRHRRRRYTRGWGASPTLQDSPSDLEGVSLIRRGSWGEEQIPVPPPTEEHRGLLSVAVEFLFGPTTPSGPSEEEKWRLRGAVIVDKSLSRNGAISLRELAPFADSPPASWTGIALVVSEGLLVVSHFNGKPAGKPLDETEDLSTSLFDFPELLAESRFAIHYSGPRIGDEEDNDSIFFIRETQVSSSNRDELNSLPDYLHEQRKVLTKLSSKQFYHCLFVAILNFIGVIWFAQSLEPGGILQQSLGAIGPTLKWGLIPVLLFYAKVFFLIPMVRLIYIVVWNQFCTRRNTRRLKLATSLQAKETPET
jgi:hypothetical protein